MFDRAHLTGMIKRLLYLVITVLSTFACFAQGAKVDSLEQLLQNTNQDQMRIHLLCEIAWELRRDNPPMAVRNAQKALAIARSINRNSDILIAFQRIGTAKKYEADFPAAINYFDSAHTFALEIGDTLGAIKAVRSRADVHRDLGEYEGAHKSLNTALDLLDWKRDSTLLAKTYLSIGNLYDRTGDYAAAKVALERGLEIAVLQRELGLQAKFTYQIAIASYRSGESERAQLYLYDAMMIQRHLGRADLLGGSLNLFGLIWQERGKMDSSIHYFEESLAMKRVAGDYRGESVTKRNLAEVLMLSGHFARARSECDSGLATAVKLGLIADQRGYFELLSALSDSLGDYVGALHYKRSAAKMADSIWNREKLTSVQSLETERAERELEMQELATKLQEQRASDIEREVVGLRLWLAFAGLGALSVILLLLLLRFRSKSRALRDQKTIATLESKAAKSLIEGQEHERTRIAQDLHDRVGSILSTVKHNFQNLEQKVDDLDRKQDEQFTKALGMLDTAVSEVRLISKNMDSGVLTQFGLVDAVQELASNIKSAGRMEINVVTIAMEERIANRKTELLTFRIIQELLTNALKHSKALLITVKLEKRDNGLHVLVKDNGQGFDPDTRSAESGMGLQNVQHRAEVLKAELNIESHRDSGTSVRLLIPLATDT